MSLTTAHKILITTGVIASVAFAARAFYFFSRNGQTSYLITGIVTTLAAIGLTWYLRFFIRKVRADITSRP